MIAAARALVAPVRWLSRKSDIDPFKDRRKGTTTLFALLSLLLSSAVVRADAPPNGTRIKTPFCGTVYETTLGFSNHGVQVDQPYYGWFELIQEPPDDPQAEATEWSCDQNSYGCGTFHMILPGFVPPQFEGDPSFTEVDITGPVETIRQTSTTYHLTANVDDFVVDSGPAYLGAVGDATTLFLCPGCPDINDPQTIHLEFTDAFSQIQGDLILLATVPGIGGSLSPPEGSQPETRAFIARLGPACNYVLPASSSLGLIVLVGLLIASALFVVGGK